MYINKMCINIHYFTVFDICPTFLQNWCFFLTTSGASILRRYYIIKDSILVINYSIIYLIFVRKEAVFFN